MRVELPGVRRRDAPFEVSFEGQPVEAWAGESIAAALLSAGISDLRTTAAGDRRGLYCGMGVCGECRVTVDGVNRRSCMTAAAPGQRVRRADAKAEPTTVETRPAHAAIAPDVLIVGAGPGGLSAARAAAQTGLDVVVADERGQTGGQYFKQPGQGFDLDEASLDAQFREGRALASAAAAAGARLLRGATLWAAGLTAEGDPDLHLLVDGAAMAVRPRRLILAMGAYERPWPVPGWTLPGVMTSGAAQTLLRAYQTAPGRRVLIAGNGPLNLQVAHELHRAGAEVVALAEQAPAPGPAQIVSALRMAATAPGLVRAGVAHLAALRRAKVAIRHGHALIRVDGDDRARRAVIGAINADGSIVPGSEKAFDVDAVCVGYGFLPQAEAARALGCDFRAGPNGALEAVRDEDGRTTVSGVFIAGDGGSLGGARVAIAQGVAAAAAVAEDLGQRVDRADRSRARRQLGRHQAFQRALWSVYAPVGPFASDDPDVLVCRCENVTARAIAALAEGDHSDIGAIKRASRAGMGACQGRYCASLLAMRLPHADGVELPGFAPRPPFKPLPIAAIAGLDNTTA